MIVFKILWLLSGYGIWRYWSCSGSSSSIYGGTFLAMTGKDSVLLACDSRFSSQQSGPFLLGEQKRYVFHVGGDCLVGCYGLDADAHTMRKSLIEKIVALNLQKLPPKVLARLLSSYLYKTNSICSPIIAGRSLEGPYIASLDGLGAITPSNNFAVTGTSAKSVYAVLESIYESELDPEELVSVAEKVFKLALQRDVLSGCTVRILTITKDGIFEKNFHTDDV